MEQADVAVAAEHVEMKPKRDGFKQKKYYKKKESKEDYQEKKRYSQKDSSRRTFKKINPPAASATA